MHDPVVFFDQHRLHLHLVRGDAQQGSKILVPMEEISWYADPLRWC
jgi:hypothetical protein